MLIHENTWAASRPNAPRPKPRTSPPAARLGEVRVPVLVVVGVGEMPALLREAEFVARSIAGAELLRVDGAGHFVNLEQPAKYNEIATGWLKRVDAR
jgi:pimeloyl-ACP methyl ester carboxylesterase